MRRALVIAAACAVMFGSSSAWAQRPQPQVSHPVPQSAPAVAAAPAGVVNINVASEDELERLPGIGPARAAAIVTLRQRVQHFRSADDLLRIRGIGHVAMRRLRPFITLTGATTLAARPARIARGEAPISAH
jgi:competence protein ComEA